MDTSTRTANFTPTDTKIEVLVITPQYAPDYGPSAPIYTALCEDLQQIGCNVTVVTAFPHYAGAELVYPHSKKWFEEDVLNGVRIIRTYVYTVPKSSLWRRLLYQASYNFFATLALLKAGKPQVILADAPTLWSGLPLVVGALLRRKPFIYIIHDIYPDVLLRLGVLKNRRMLNLIEKVEQFFYKRSAQISVLSTGFKNNLVRKGVPAGKIAIIPVCVDIDFIRPLPRQNKFRQQWDLGDRFVALYAGNIGFSQGLEIVVKAAEQLRDHPEIAIVIVGEGAMKADLQKQINSCGLQNIKIYPFQPRECVPLLYAMADVCLIPLKQDIVVESVPSKTYTIMASGRPFIATVDKNSEVGILVDQAQCGLCVEPENAAGMAKAILDLSTNEAIRSQMGNKGRDFVVAKYSRRVGAEQYHQLIRKSLQRTRHDPEV